ncbi:putative Adenylate/guanylate cyclase [Candidatus Terasakiella magnetica]|uniref:Putative Adenylate/guanylate cyclase n=1 Tax=Candidatus Terasakiella magnetica TaxID=1867952 RepID=A0A1C3RCL1_9PROT|nr:adenylate/guanylate cyclase domain-containing protein [Candidatus Terasakiella magnetica]SCA55017.1 putative Adenylate/guanylate cyclase [Candidatus Terasakiella magnetica]
MNLWKKITFPRQPIQYVLFYGFGGLILLAVAVVLYLGLSSTTKLTKDYHHILIETALDKLTSEVEGLLLPVESQTLWISDQFKEGKINLHDHKQIKTFLRGVLAGTPNVSGLGLQYKDGITRYMLRKDNQWIEKKRISTAENTRLFSLMSMAKTNVWSKLIWDDKEEQTIVDVRTPIYQDGELKAILFIGVTVADLSKTILSTSSDRFLTPFILYGRNHILAHPLLTSGRTVSDELGARADWITGKGDIPLPSVDDFQDVKLASLVHGSVTKAGLITPIDNVQVNRARVDGDMYIVATKEIVRFGQTPWVLGVYINAGKSDSTAALQLFEMAGAGLIVLVISVILSMKVGKKLARPIVRLAESAKTVRKGELDNVPLLPRSRLRELDQAALAFNEMVQGIQERDMIREVFGRYVPESIASSLMEEDGELQPIATEATILFSDIEGFTQLTEKVGPDKIVAILNQYFNAVVNVLERHGGVVTQFQGDAVLATFNVPIKSDDHAENALKAALEIKQMLLGEKFDGITIKSRIGLNTGNVVAGAVGAEGRLNYTVHGDAVNLASRIENLNKHFKTDILISGNTAKQIKTISLETVGTTEVRGLTAPVRLYVPKT